MERKKKNDREKKGLTMDTHCIIFKYLILA